MRLVLPTVAVLAAIGFSRAATADPAASRVITAPTAWLPQPGAVVGTATLDHRGDGSIDVGVGLGGIAALDVGTDTDVRGCTGCTDERPDPIYLGRASFRLGAPQDTWFKGMPALVLGTRTTFAAAGKNKGYGRVRVTDIYAAASRVIGPLRLHAGVMAFDAGFGPDTVTTLGPTVRPFGAIEFRPPQYDKTTLMTDIAYEPLLEKRDVPKVEPEWVIGWGVRYQAFWWGAIDLAVRHREGEGLGDSTVMVRLSGVMSAPPATH